MIITSDNKNNMDYEFWGTSEMIEELAKRGYNESDLQCWGDSELIEELNK